MPRFARVVFPNHFYHIMNRGLERRNIFRNNKDLLRFLDRLSFYKKKFDWIIYCYCLLPNHYHLLIQAKDNPLGKILKSLQTSYGVYFNNKYKRVGPVFAGRYKSIICQEDEYLLQVSKYIHLNPVKASLCKKPIDYPYSSYQEYIKGYNSYLNDNIIDKRAMKRIIGNNINKQSINNYRSFVEEQEDLIEYKASKDVFGNKRFVTKFKKLA